MLIIDFVIDWFGVKGRLGYRLARMGANGSNDCKILEHILVWIPN